MLYNVNSVKEYLEALDPDWRKEKLLKIRNIIKSNYPEIIEIISYKMLGYKDEKGLLFHLNAQQKYVSFYVGNIKKVDPENILISGLNRGKGCIRILKTNNVEDSGLGKFIKQAVTLWRNDVDIDC